MVDLSGDVDGGAFRGPRRALPHSLEAEKSVVGGILLHPKAFLAIVSLVSPEDFYHPTHREIFRAMIDLDEANKPIDEVTVADQMRANDSLGSLRAFGGEAYFAELSTNVVTVENIEFHARIVRTKATVRKLIEAAQEIAAHGYGEHGDSDDFIDGAEHAVFEIAQRSASGQPEDVKKILALTIRNVETRYENKQDVTGVPTGIFRFDMLTAGFQPSELIIIAGRPGMGKTSYIMNAVSHAALEADMPALVFSLEMSSAALVERLLSSEARVDSTRLRSGRLEQRDWINLTKAAGRISEAKIKIDDAGAPYLLEIRAKCRRWRSDKNIFKKPDQLGIIVIDYLQLVNGRKTDGHEQNREREVSEISRGLKALAKELRIPIVALSQLNRGVESRADKRPQLSDLRESGAIEQDADVIAFLYRDEVYNKESSAKGTAEIIIGKNRNGPVSTVHVGFIPQYTLFENLRDADG